MTARKPQTFPAAYDAAAMERALDDAFRVVFAAPDVWDWDSRRDAAWPVTPIEGRV